MRDRTIFVLIAVLVAAVSVAAGAQPERAAGAAVTEAAAPAA